MYSFKEFDDLLKFYNIAKCRTEGKYAKVDNEGNLLQAMRNKGFDTEPENLAAFVYLIDQFVLVYPMYAKQKLLGLSQEAKFYLKNHEWLYNIFIYGFAPECSKFYSSRHLALCIKNDKIRNPDKNILKTVTFHFNIGALIKDMKAQLFCYCVVKNLLKTDLIDPKILKRLNLKPERLKIGEIQDVLALRRNKEMLNNIICNNRQNETEDEQEMGT